MLQEIPNKKHIFVAVAVEIPLICKRFLYTDLFNFHSISNMSKHWEIWTLDLLFVRETLWPAELSAFSERRDLNPKPPIPKIGALPNYELLSVINMLGKRFELLTFSFSGKRSKPTELPKQFCCLQCPPPLPRWGTPPQGCELQEQTSRPYWLDLPRWGSPLRGEGGGGVAKRDYELVSRSALYYFHCRIQLGSCVSNRI